MIRISTIFVGICMVLVAASLGMVLFTVVGLSGLQSSIVALTVLTLLILFNAVSMRARDRSNVHQQIDDLSRGTGDLAKQVAEFGRKLAAMEGKIVSANSAGQDRVHAVMGEIGELGSLVRQLAGSVASHDDILASAWQTTPTPTITPPPAPLYARAPDPIQALLPFADLPLSAPEVMPPSPPVATPGDTLLVKVKNAIEANRIDIYLQPIVTLPQRKVRFYEAVTRLRDETDTIITPESFIGTAESAGLMGRIDHAVILRCMQVLRRLMVRNKDVGVFCNIAAATLRSESAFAQVLDFLEANRALAASFVLEFKQATFRGLGPIESEHLAALAQRGFRFSIDNVTDLRIEPRDLADRGVRFLKVPAALLLDHRQGASSDIDAADLSDLLGRFGIDLIAERIEGERAVVDLLDFDVRFGQGFLFAAPRPLRPDAASATAEAPDTAKSPAIRPTPDPVAQDIHVSKRPSTFDIPRDQTRATGNAALVRR
ncbi:MAG: hypothetical protein JWQ82_207 [Tardiphaga sp.]|nr:hypothetical protein [Tardiphaga sp.]